MHRELDDLLSGETSVDSWYDYGCIIASEILSEFSLEDWEELSKSVANMPLAWQRKLAYCMDSSCNMHELKILLELLNTEDEELFEICIDTLRSFTNPESKQLIAANPSILDRISNLKSKASLPVKMILEDFLKKIYS
ncbi:hypothetical protein DNH61_24875 [Paenibacillus sambharensis]|uniref:HEAT repeat domain-containing protein n=1 Tax=Paenibacillus sambharensis TaxID=1803190 RepID=A0A2W1LDH8_9BACL|nr:hypothetical protein [Paenibacillus sambharensis]PZD93115.1 hypothetical protein DNH61_24875 [Paenibacillus sambharensis]